MGHDAELFKKAEVALKKNNHEYAIELILQGLLINPKAAEWRVRLHQIETRAIEEKGGNPAGGFSVKFKVLPHESKAKKLHLQKKYDEEIIELERSLKFQPQNLGTLESLARALQLADHVDSAIAVHEEIIKIDSGKVESYRSLGKLHAEAKDDPEKAIEFWEKVKQYKPDDKEAGKAVRDLSAATMVRKAEERKKGGDGSFRDMLKSEEESAELEAKAQIIRNDDDRKRAIKRKITELKEDPKNGRLLREIGQLYQDLKLWDKAEVAYRKAIQINANDLAAQERLGTLAENRLDNELETLAEKASGSDDSEAKAKLEAKQKEVQAFKLKEYKRRVEAHPTDYTLKLQYGNHLRIAGHYDEAIGLYQQAVKDPKNKVPARVGIGECFLNKELFDMAKDQFVAAIGEIADKESGVWKETKYSLGDACEKNQEIDEALTHFQEIMSVDISYKDVSARVTNLRKAKS